MNLIRFTWLDSIENNFSKWYDPVLKLDPKICGDDTFVQSLESLHPFAFE